MTISGTNVAVWNRALGRIGVTQFVESEDDDTDEAEACRLVYDDLVRELLEQRHWPWALKQMDLTSVEEQVSTVAYADAVDPFDTFTIPFGYIETTQIAVVHIDANDVETTLTAGDDYSIDGSELTLDDPLIADESIRITVTAARIGWDNVYGLPDDYVAPVGLLREDVRHMQTPAASRIPFAVMQNDGGDGFVLCTSADGAVDDFVAFEYVAMVDEAIMPRLFVDALAWRIAVELALSLKKDPKLSDYCRQMTEVAIDKAMAHALNNEGHEPQPLTPLLRERL